MKLEDIKPGDKVIIDGQTHTVISVTDTINTKKGSYYLSEIEKKV